ncbi:MAG: thermonuclease family protein [Pseudomonadota bacterium]
MRTHILLLTLLLPVSAHAAECEVLYTYEAKITEVYDGDTVTADIDLGFDTWKHDEKLRLVGIDAPEVKGAEKAEGIKSRDALRTEVLGKDVTVCTFQDKQGKYGRYLATLFVNDRNINDWLVTNGYAARASVDWVA